MKNEELSAALCRMKVETGSLVCLGCGKEHDCSTHGCAILREAAERLQDISKRGPGGLTMPKYIEVKALGVDRCNPDVVADRAYAAGWNGLLNIINSAPTADVAPVVHGQWEPVDPEGDVLSRCSRCGRIISSSWGCCEDEDTKGCNGCDPSDEWLNCPTCGALMDGKDEDNG